MGRTNWKLASFVLLILASGPGCRDRNAPEISVRNPTRVDPTADQTKNPPRESKTSVLTLNALEKINEQTWAVALLTVQDAETGSIKIAETFANSAMPPSYEIPYGSYFITLEYFLDAAKTQSLARTCDADKTRIHKVNQETFSFVSQPCMVTAADTASDAADVAIRPVVIQ